MYVHNTNNIGIPISKKYLRLYSYGGLKMTC